MWKNSLRVYPHCLVKDHSSLLSFHIFSLLILVRLPAIQKALNILKNTHFYSGLGKTNRHDGASQPT